MKRLTARQSEILEFIKGFISEFGLSPSIRDIGNHYSMTPNGAYDHVIALMKKGKISMNGKGASRSIIITENINYIIDKDVIAKNRKYEIVKAKMSEIPKGIKCILCNSIDNTERHHEDYNSPYITIDLCRKHHRKLHQIKRLIKKNGYELSITKVVND